MKYRKYKYLRLDGSSSIMDRRDMVKDFQFKSVQRTCFFPTLCTIFTTLILYSLLTSNKKKGTEFSLFHLAIVILAQVGHFCVPAEHESGRPGHQPHGSRHGGLL